MSCLSVMGTVGARRLIASRHWRTWDRRPSSVDSWMPDRTLRCRLATVAVKCARRAVMEVSRAALSAPGRESSCIYGCKIKIFFVCKDTMLLKITFWPPCLKTLFILRHEMGTAYVYVGFMSDILSFRDNKNYTLVTECGHIYHRPHFDINFTQLCKARITGHALNDLPHMRQCQYFISIN